jgi:hypothetical protein
VAAKADRFPDQSFTFGVASALVSGLMVILLTFTGLAARECERHLPKTPLVFGIRC